MSIRDEFEEWWFDPTSADNGKIYQVSPDDVEEIRRLSSDISWSSWQAAYAAGKKAEKEACARYIEGMKNGGAADLVVQSFATAIRTRSES